MIRENSADAVREALERFDHMDFPAADAVSVGDWKLIRAHIDKLESRLAALAGAAPDNVGFVDGTRMLQYSPRYLDEHGAPPAGTKLYAHAPAKAREVSERALDDFCWAVFGNTCADDPTIRYKISAALATFAEGE